MYVEQRAHSKNLARFPLDQTAAFQHRIQLRACLKPFQLVSSKLDGGFDKALLFFSFLHREGGLSRRLFKEKWGLALAEVGQGYTTCEMWQAGGGTLPASVHLSVAPCKWCFA